jgi:hypothetical protein
MKKDQDGVLVITYIRADGSRGFRCRCQTGKTYLLLYEKLRKSSYKCVHEDFPWDYWIFTDKRDEDSFLEAFKWFIVYEDQEGNLTELEK